MRQLGERSDGEPDRIKRLEPGPGVEDLEHRREHEVDGNSGDGDDETPLEHGSPRKRRAALCIGLDLLAELIVSAMLSHS